MLRLIVKILIAYWIAAGLVIFIADVEPHRQIHHPELTDALNSSMALNGRLIADEYESGRCAQLGSVLSTQIETLSVATPDGKTVCGSLASPQLSRLVQSVAHSGKRMSTNHSIYQLVALPLTSTTGKQYVVLLKSNYTSSAELYGMLPGYTTITISFVVAFVLAVLVALPIRRLRTAAREIATGNLETRVRWGPVLERVFGKRSKDDVARLVCDFNYMAERLQSLTESQKLLLRDVSHELRSPLTRLGMGLGLARREATDKPMREHLDRIESEAKRLNDLIGQILSLSYLETSQGMLPTGDVHLDELVTDLLPTIKYEAEQCGCVITTRIESGCNVKGDQELLRSAVENIIRNAIRYVPYTGLIHVETIHMEYNGENESLIRISDNGPGIPEEELQAVLEPFYRGKESKGWRQGGFGIGLAIAHRAAGVHGGSIQLRNRPEGGLTVEMRLPQNA